jgi:hypothetical protein
VFVPNDWHSPTATTVPRRSAVRGEFRHQARLSHPRLGRDADDAPAAGACLVELGADRIELRPPADHGQLGVRPLPRGMPFRARQRE